MRGRDNSKWIYVTSDEGPCLCCEKCKRKISAKDVMFADRPFTECPKCHRHMSDVDDEIIENLRNSML